MHLSVKIVQGYMMASEPCLTRALHSPPCRPATVASAPSTSGVAPGQQAGSLLLSGGAFVLPHPDKMAKGGEDWFFISDSKRAMGVADGVGGWVSKEAHAIRRGHGHHGLGSGVGWFVAASRPPFQCGAC